MPIKAFSFPIPPINFYYILLQSLLGCEKEIGFRGMDNSHDGHDGLGVRRYRRVSGRKRRNGAYMGLDFLVRFSSARSIS